MREALYRLLPVRVGRHEIFFVDARFEANAPGDGEAAPLEANAPGDGEAAPLDANAPGDGEAAALDANAPGDGDDSAAPADGTAAGGAVYVTFQLVTYGASDTIKNLHEQECLFVPFSRTAHDPKRLTAFAEGWARALPSLLGRLVAEQPDDAAPVDLVCPPAFDEAGAESADDFAALLLRDDGPQHAWRRALAADLGQVDDVTYAAFLATARPEGAHETEARRRAARARAAADCERLAAKVARTYGLRLPRHVEAFWAFFTSLSPSERDAFDDLVGFRPAGILDWLAPGGLERAPRDGLDERLHWRYRGDPPEFVSVLHGTSDAQHFGLFYDDPRFAPSGVAVNYARDSAETWWSAPTLLEVIRESLPAHSDDPSSTLEALEHHNCRTRLLRDALDAFADDDRRARADDEAGALMPYEARRAVPEIVCGVGVVGPDGVAVELPYLAEGPDVVFSPSAERSARLRAWIDDARAALDRGEALFALGLGRDLHWLDADEFRAESLELMTRAYRALGRDTLAAIAEVHHAHRDLPSVDVYRDLPSVDVYPDPPSVDG
ncbi:MAG TPA: ADP-ribosylation family protein [Polyangiaceae bacterium]|nr:ADP-ribosylation family protein [Polyangiaceae bacterium]